MVSSIWPIETETKWSPFCRLHFQVHLFVRQWWYFDSNFTEICGAINHKQALIKKVAWLNPATNHYRNQWLHNALLGFIHDSNVIMSAMTSQITGVSSVCSAVCSCANQRKRKSSASLAFVRGIHQWPVDSPHKGPVTRKMFPFDDIMGCVNHVLICFMVNQWNVATI